MTHDESPFQSPRTPQTQTPRRPFWLRDQPLVRLLFVAAMWHVASFGFWIMLGAFLYRLIGTTSQAIVWQSPVFFFVPVALLVFALLSWVMGMVSVILITRKWHAWPGVTTLALLAAVPGVMLIVASYVLVRSRREWVEANAP